MYNDISAISNDVQYLSNHLSEQLDSSIKIMFLEFDSSFVCTSVTGLYLDKIVVNHTFYSTC